MVPPEDVRATLDALLASDGFINSLRLSRFLRFTVEKALAGEGAELKEYLLGTEVFDRGQDFDPRLDPIVRVEARRLRSKLQEYYDGPGRESPVRITMRKGSYAPAFEHSSIRPVFSGPAGTQFRKRLHWPWLWPFLAIVLVAGVLAYRSRISPSALHIVVVPSADSGDREFADGLGEAVAVELARNPKLRVVAWPLYVEYRQRIGDSPDGSLLKITQDLKAEAVLAISVRQKEDRWRITAMLMNPKLGWKRWAGEYERGLNDTFAVQRELARAIAEEIRGGLEKDRGQ